MTPVDGFAAISCRQMRFPEIYLSAPTLHLPSVRLTNADMLERVRARYEGSAQQWELIERRIQGVFRLCGSEIRYREEEHPFPMADQALIAAEACLREQQLPAGTLDRVIYGGISREYFEPATAAEIAGRLGAHGALAFDVVGACAGSLLGIQNFAAQVALDEEVRNGLVCTLGVTVGHISYSIQTPEEARLLAAGLTVGNASTAMALSTRPLPQCGRVLLARAEGHAAHWALCKAPLNMPFIAESIEIFRVSRPITIQHVQKTLAMVGWKAGEVDHVICHQPSNRVVQELALSLGLPLENTLRLHHLFGNTESSAVPMSLRYQLDHGGIRPGAKVLLVAAAGGILVASAAVEWCG